MPDKSAASSSRQEPAPPKSWRKATHDILEHTNADDPVSLAVNTGLVALILLNVAAFAAETVPAIGERYGEAFELFNLLSVAIFTLEYVARLWSCVEIPLFHDVNPSRARAHFASRPLLLVDLMAILPFYLSFLLAMDLRLLRVLRLFRFLKLARYSPALYSLARVIRSEWRALTGALLVMMALLLFASTGIYFIERGVQPDVFGSIPQSAWWALATLTTVGYGDVVPLTPLGRMFGGLVMIFGLGMFALPIAIIASGFSQEANRHEFVVTWSIVVRVPIFAQLDSASLSEIMALLYSRTYPAGAPILRVGDTADSMFFIASGEVVVDGDAGPVTLAAGDFFGEMALIEQRQREHNVTARRKCRLLLLDKADFDRLCHRMPEIIDQIRGVADARQQAAQQAAR